MSHPVEPIPLTEQENPRTEKISSLPTAEILRLMNDEDARVAGAVAAVLPHIAAAVDLVAETQAIEALRTRVESARRLSASILKHEEELKTLSHISTSKVFPEIDQVKWGKNSAPQAFITLQRPVRIAIHAKQMIKSK